MTALINPIKSSRQSLRREACALAIVSSLRELKRLGLTSQEAGVVLEVARHGVFAPHWDVEEPSRKRQLVSVAQATIDTLSSGATA